MTDLNSLTMLYQKKQALSKVIISKLIMAFLNALAIHWVFSSNIIS